MNRQPVFFITTTYLNFYISWY